MTNVPTITIRDVVAEDAEPCAAIINEWWDETNWITREEDETPENVRADFRKAWPRPRAVVAERDGELLGYLVLDRKDAEVGGIFVATKHRRSGAGTALMNYAKSVEPKGLTLWVAEANKAARKFYDLHGFEKLHYKSPDKDDHPGGGDFLLKWPGIRLAQIETERLILRRPRQEDCAATLAFFQSDRAEYVGGKISELNAWIKFAAELGHWEMRGWGMFTVTRKGSDEAIGLVGPWRPDGFPENELGWLLFEGADGQGYGLEAATAARRYAYDTLGWKTAVSYIDPQNERSIRLATRLGAVRDEAAPAPHPDDLVYRHPRPEALAT